ncbi:hypothetical protein HYT51_01000 [Candidatus Woesearchaeota archaeon]|nr:hypothetical protein [Candidatus Woesearchaeota archaeon]
MKKERISLIIGFILVVGSILASIFLKFPFWYSFYVIGAFIFFGTFNYTLKTKSVFSYILSNKWKNFLFIYIISVFFGFFVDIIYGRLIGDLWYYPYLNGIWDYFFPIFFYYPFGGLQVYEIFYFLKAKFSKIISSERAYQLSENAKTVIIDVLILLLIFGLVYPILNLVYNTNRSSDEVMTIIIVTTVFSLDAIVYKIKKDSIFLELIQGNKLMIVTMLFSWIVATLLTEFPNTFSWEWIYYNIPFIKTEILKINVIIFTFGWFWLVFAPLRGIDLVKALFGIDEVHKMK